MASGWNLCVWLECIGWLVGVVVRRYIKYPHNPYYLFLLHLYYIALFLQQHHYFFVHFKNVFHSCLLFLCNKANVAQIKEHSRSLNNRDHANVKRTSTARVHARVSRLHVRGTA